VFVAGVDGYHAGWIAFKGELPSLVTSVAVIELPVLLRERPPELACLGIDIPIGLLDGSRACDKAARKLLGQPRVVRCLHGELLYNPPILTRTGGSGSGALNV